MQHSNIGSNGRIILSKFAEVQPPRCNASMKILQSSRKVGEQNVPMREQVCSLSECCNGAERPPCHPKRSSPRLTHAADTMSKTNDRFHNSLSFLCEVKAQKATVFSLMVKAVHCLQNAMSQDP